MNETDNIELRGIPIFRILNYAEAIAYYVNFLGFRIDWEYRLDPSDPVYMQMSFNGLVLHLSENERFKKAVVIFVESKGIEKFHSELLSRKTDFPVPDVSTTNWNTKQLELEDPFGNLMRFNENIAA